MKTTRAWVEDEDLIRRNVDDTIVDRMLQRGTATGLERRGVVRASRQRASYDREGRYPLDGKVYPHADGSFLVVANEDMFRAGDTVYVDVQGHPKACIVDAVRAGTRVGDTPLTRVLTVHPR
jgi:IS5 family transposase